MKPTKNNSVLVASKGQRCEERERLVTGGQGGCCGEMNTFIHSIAFSQVPIWTLRGDRMSAMEPPTVTFLLLSVGGCPQDP